VGDDGTPIAYSALQNGVVVVSASGHQFGTVAGVLEIPAEDVFRGIIVRTGTGLRFVDRDHIEQITATHVTCALDAEQVERLPSADSADLYEHRVLQPTGYRTPSGVVSVVRCSRGALFETLWIPTMSFKAIRLGRFRLQHCPVHGRWELVERVDPDTLTSTQRAFAARYPAGPIP
jgi:hypothetical protein